MNGEQLDNITGIRNFLARPRRKKQ